MSAPLPANVARFTGFTDVYEAHRPQPPRVLVDVLTQLAHASRPRLVVDLGSGTGLSTRLWAGYAQDVVGIDPNEDMRRQAQQRNANLSPDHPPRYLAGHSTATGLPDGCADIVTCCQSLHWMEPEATFAEIDRILRRGGVFAACDADFPPTITCEAEAVYNTFHDRVYTLDRQCETPDPVKRWPKAGHLDRMKASGRFRWTKEVLLHQAETGDAERLVGLSLSFGTVPSLRNRGVSDAQLGVDEFRAQAKRVLGDQVLSWYFSFRVRIGLK